MLEHIYVQTGDVRTRVDSLYPYLRRPLKTGQIVDASLMEPDHAEMCPWIGYGMGKGVTHISEPISVFCLPKKLKRGLHGKLIQGFPNIDVDDRVHCYDPNPEKGFGGFIRWIYFADPVDVNEKTTHGVFGIDWSLEEKTERGIANSMRIVSRIVRRARSHGIPSQAQVALLDPWLNEPEVMKQWRRKERLWTVADWVNRGQRRFEKETWYCAVCGNRTFVKPHRFCYRCGAERSRTLEV